MHVTAPTTAPISPLVLSAKQKSQAETTRPVTPPPDANRGASADNRDTRGPDDLRDKAAGADRADTRDASGKTQKNGPSEMAAAGARAFGAGIEPTSVRSGGAAELAPQWPRVQAAPPERWVEEGPAAIQGPAVGLDQAEADFAAAERAEERERFQSAAQGYSSFRLAIGGQAIPRPISVAA